MALAQEKESWEFWTAVCSSWAVLNAKCTDARLAERQNWEIKCLLIAYFLTNTFAKNYQNRCINYTYSISLLHYSISCKNLSDIAYSAVVVTYWKLTVHIFCIMLHVVCSFFCWRLSTEATNIFVKWRWRQRSKQFGVARMFSLRYVLYTLSIVARLRLNLTFCCSL